MPQLVDVYRLMLSNRNTFYEQMTNGVKILYYNVYAQFTEIILQSQIFVANIKEEMAAIAAKVFHKYENLKDTFNVQITSNNSAWARKAEVLKE